MLENKQGYYIYYLEMGGGISERMGEGCPPPHVCGCIYISPGELERCYCPTADSPSDLPQPSVSQECLHVTELAGDPPRHGLCAGWSVR